VTRLTTERLPLAFDAAPRLKLARDEASERGAGVKDVMAGMLDWS